MGSSEKIRIFIALEISEKVVMFLKTLQRDMVSEKFKVSWPRPETLHLTLRFLGDISPGVIGDVEQAMSSAARDVEPFALHLGGVGVFPSVKGARVAWAGVRGATDALARLRNALEQELSARGYPGERGRFVPHVTLARFKGFVDPRTVTAMVQKYRDHRSDTFVCQEMGLFKSDLLSSGARHTCLATIGLAGRPGGPGSPGDSGSDRQGP